MREALGCSRACALGKQWCALRERFLGGAELRRAVSAVMKQRLAALGDTRVSWSMQRLRAESRCKTQRRGKLKRMILSSSKTLGLQSEAPSLHAALARRQGTPWGCAAGLLRTSVDSELVCNNSVLSQSLHRDGANTPHPTAAETFSSPPSCACNNSAQSTRTAAESTHRGC